MISYRKIHPLLRARMAQDGLSLRGLADKVGIDYGTLWRLLKAKDNLQKFETGKGRRGKIIMNITAETVDRLCLFLGCQPGNILVYKKSR